MADSEKTDTLDHLSLGSVRRWLPTKGDIKDGLKLGLGAALGVTAGNLVLTQALPRIGVIVPARWSGVALALTSIVLSKAASRMVGSKVAEGMVAGGVGVVVSEWTSKLLGGVGVAAAAEPALMGVGTPDMSAARMFNGATVAIEEPGMGLRGSTLQYEDVGSFAGTLS